MTRTPGFFLALALAGACATDNDASQDDAAVESSGPADTSSDGATTGDIAALFECDEATPTLVGPLVGPGYDESMGGLLEPVVDTYVVSTTIAFPYADKMDDFLEVSTGVQAAIDRSAVVAVQLVIEPNCGFFRTMTVWRSQADMLAFVGSPEHSTAIARSSELVLAGKVTAWKLPAAEFPPTWDMAKAQLVHVSPFGGGY